MNKISPHRVNVQHLVVVLLQMMIMTMIIMIVMMIMMIMMETKMIMTTSMMMVCLHVLDSTDKGVEGLSTGGRVEVPAPGL